MSYRCKRPIRIGVWTGRKPPLATRSRWRRYVVELRTPVRKSRAMRRGAEMAGQWGGVGFEIVGHSGRLGPAGAN